MAEAQAAEQKRMDIRWWSAYKKVFLALHGRETDPEQEFSGIAAKATDAVFTALGLRLW